MQHTKGSSTLIKSLTQFCHAESLCQIVLAVSQWEREDALREACNAINAAAASNATLIDADPEKKGDDNESDNAVGNAPATLAPFAYLHQASRSQKEPSIRLKPHHTDGANTVVDDQQHFC